MRILRQIDQHAASDADLRRQARTLAADRILDDLHQQRLAFVNQALDRQRLFRRDLAKLPDIGHMQKRRALKPDVDKRRLHSGQHAHDFSQVDVADDATRRAALDVQLLDDAGEQNGNSRFLRGDVDQNVFHGARRWYRSHLGRTLLRALEFRQRIRLCLHCM